MKMAEVKTMIIGGRNFGKTRSIELALINHDNKIFIEREVKNLENAGIENAREVLDQAMQVFSFNDLQNALSDLITASSFTRNSLDELKDIQVRFKNNQPLENKPSKYFSKPKNNFKRR